MIRTHNSKSDRWRKTSRKPGEAGQAIVFMLLVLGLFLLGAIAFSVDMGNLWFHRQAAQSAADAACVAGAMDLLVDSQGGATGHQGFTIGTEFDCAAHSAYIPCKYAALNGYDGANTTPGNQVYVSFPATVAGATAPPAGISPQSPGGTAYPFMRVDVLDHVQTYFAGLLSGSRTQDVRAFAACGTLQASAPIPILVLKPTGSGTFSMNGGGSSSGITIVGGPSQSIQVNSSDPNAVSCSGACSNTSVDLTHAGPNTPPDGADFGVWGGPATAPSPALPICGTADPNCWKPRVAPIADPFAALAVPAQPGSTPATVTYGVKGDASWGCPDTINGCDHYTPGYYPSGITIKQNKFADGSNGSGGTGLAVFEPGVYYLAGTRGFQADSNSCIRPGTTATVGQPNIGGTVFYLAGSGSANVTSNSGKTSSGNPCSTAANFAPTSGGATGFGVKCTSGSVIPGNLPTFTGNVLLAPCTGTYGDQTLATTGNVDPTLGQQRGILFFQSRAAQNANASVNGGGTYITAGTLYFHACNASGTGLGCTYYSDSLTLGGTGGGSTYTFGDIVTDSLSLGGASSVTMDLNPGVTFGILKATLIR